MVIKQQLNLNSTVQITTVSKICLFPSEEFSANSPVDSAFRSIFRLVEVLVIWMKDRCHSLIFGQILEPDESPYKN